MTLMYYQKFVTVWRHQEARL